MDKPKYNTFWKGEVDSVQGYGIFAFCDIKANIPMQSFEQYLLLCEIIKLAIADAKKQEYESITNAILCTLNR